MDPLDLRQRPERPLPLAEFDRRFAAQFWKNPPVPGRPPSRFRNALSIATIALLAMAILLLLVTRATGIQLRAVLTGSMEPELPVGSLIFAVPTPFNQINVGDDITFVRDEKLTVVTHRVVGKDLQRQRLTTKGISNNAADAPVHYDNVLGVVKFHIPAIGYLFIWLGSTRGKIIAITGIVAVWLLSLIMERALRPEGTRPHLPRQAKGKE